MPVTSAPNLHIGSDIKPPPHPISKIFKPFNGILLSTLLKWLVVLSNIYSILTD